MNFVRMPRAVNGDDVNNTAKSSSGSNDCEKERQTFVCISKKSRIVKTPSEKRCEESVETSHFDHKSFEPLPLVFEVSRIHQRIRCW